VLIIQGTTPVKNANAFIFGMLVPVCVILSPAFPFLIKESAIFLWMVMFPIYVFRIKNLQGVLLLLLTALFLNIQSFGFPIDYPQKLMYSLISIFTMSYVFLANCRLDFESVKKISLGLGYGSFCLNIITIVCMYLITLGIVDILYLAEIFKFPDNIGLFRFSLGNAIEVPFLTTICTILSVRYLKSQWVILLFVAVNFMAVFIAQSRGVMLISVLHIISIYPKQSFLFKSGVPIIIFVAFFYYFDEVSIVLDSTIARFSGVDLGSTDSRMHYFKVVFDNINAQTLILGEGLLSSQRLLFDITGQLKSIESALVELIYEFGFFVSGLLLLPLITRMNHIGLIKNIPIYFYIILGQIFLLLNITPMFGLIFGLLMLLLESYRINNKFKTKSILIV
jgi:hypothetical protein